MRELRASRGAEGAADGNLLLGGGKCVWGPGWAVIHDPRQDLGGAEAAGEFRIVGREESNAFQLCVRSVLGVSQICSHLIVTVLGAVGVAVTFHR